MAVFDAAPLVGLLTAEPGAATIARTLQLADTRAISSINAAEVIDRVGRLTMAPLARVRDELARWEAGGLQIVALTADVAIAAASLRIEYYSRSTPVSLADCCAIALARERNDSLATSDRPMLRVARLIGLHVTALPDSTGKVPD
jgi:PIN domain nuclease of toxin-antitoxin system